MLNLSAFDATPLVREPFDYLVVENFLTAGALAAGRADFPAIRDAGLFPPESVPVRGGFKAVMDAMTGEAFRRAVERKFGLDLAGYPTMYTVRGHARAKDGRIHTDNASKLVTVLLYFNETPWPHAEGRLRMLNGPADLDDYAAEIRPDGGTLVAFRRSPASWHGHHRFIGPRKAIQLNWVTDRNVVARETTRHTLTATLKRLNPFAPA